MDTVTLTLLLIASVESRCGHNLRHTPVKSPTSVNYGQTAVSEWGLMPNTLKETHTKDPRKAAERYLKKIQVIKGSICPLVAIAAWETGPHTHRLSKHLKSRLKQVRLELEGKGCIKQHIDWRTVQDLCTPRELAGM